MVQIHIEDIRYEVIAICNYFDSIAVFMAFCDETRLSVLTLLRNGEKCASGLLKQVGVGQSTLSHHMRVLLESGIVVARKAGKWTYYSISENGRQYAIETLKRLTATASIGTT
jgi:ArsR family transcriptional regulator